MNRTTGDGVCRDPLERELERARKPALVEMARERGLSTTGTKVDLILVASKKLRDFTPTCQLPLRVW